MKRLVALVLVGTGCGGGGGGSVDGPNLADAPIDAGTPDGDPAARVDVHVRSDDGSGGPDAEAVVFFYDGSGTLIVFAQTDTDGDAHGYLPDGGSVTVLQSGENVELTTFRGVEAGDALVAGFDRLPPTGTPSGTMSHMTAQVAMPAGAAGFGLFTYCGGGTPNGTQGEYTVGFYASCVTPTFDVLAQAEIAGVPSFVWQPGVTYAANGTFTLADTWTAMAHADAAIAAVPANLQRVFVTSLARVGTRQVELDRATFELPAAGDHAFSMRYPQDTGAGNLLVATGIVGIQPVFRYVRASTTTFAASPLDLAGSLAVPTLSGRPTQLAAGTTWTALPAGTPDVRFVVWTGQWGSAQRVTWISVEDPSSPTTSELIPLPAEFATQDPTATVPSYTGATVAYASYDNVDGFAAARALGPQLAYPDNAFLDVAHDANVSYSLPGFASVALSSSR